MWPFKKDNGKDAAETQAEHSQEQGSGAATAQGQVSDTARAEGQGSDTAKAQEQGSVAATVPQGPYNGDTVDYREFNFSDFAKGALDLGSLLVPVPHDGEVQVEMGTDGPQMIRIVTPHGRITPVAFAAPRAEGLWVENMQDMRDDMERDGLEHSVEAGLWGEELVGTAGEGVIRVIGVDGPRWLLRMTVTGHRDYAEEMAQLAREITSRTFVYRGEEPLPVGTVLPISMPAPMAEELARQIRQRQEQINQGEG